MGCPEGLEGSEGVGNESGRVGGPGERSRICQPEPCVDGEVGVESV